MKDDIERRFGKDSCDGLFIGNVAVDTADFVGQLRKGPFRKVIQDRDLMTFFKQGFDQAGPDEAGTSRN